jgi:hypothetical protein
VISNDSGATNSTCFLEWPSTLTDKTYSDYREEELGKGTDIELKLIEKKSLKRQSSPRVRGTQ